jgi:hypothetical protein
LYEYEQIKTCSEDIRISAAWQKSISAWWAEISIRTM